MTLSINDPIYRERCNIKECALPDACPSFDREVIRSVTWPWRVRCSLAMLAWAEEKTRRFEKHQLCWGPCGTLEWTHTHTLLRSGRDRTEIMLEAWEHCEAYEEAQRWYEKWRDAALMEVKDG